MCEHLVSIFKCLFHRSNASERKTKVQNEHKSIMYLQSLCLLKFNIQKGQKLHLSAEMLYGLGAFSSLVHIHTYLIKTQEFTLHSWKPGSIFWKVVIWSKLKSRFKSLNALEILPQTVGIYSYIIRLLAISHSLCKSTRSKFTEMKF